MSKLLEQINTTNRKTFQLKDLFEISPQYGYTESASKEKIGPRFLRITDIQGNIVDWRTVPYCKISENEKSKYLLKKDDLVFARTGATTGMSYFINSDLNEDAVFASYLIRLRFNKNICSPDLLKYFFQSRNYWGQVNGSLSGSAQPGINAVVLSEMQVKLPTDLPTQKKIAEILSAYDSKIENNNKIIKNLEAAAQAIFNEWFVNFKFPGYEKAKMIESEMGKIPEGLEIKKVSELFSVILGGTPSREKSEYWGGNIPWVNSGEVNKLRILEATEHITNLGLNKSNARIIKSGATVLAITGATLGQVSRLEIDSTTNQSVVGIYDERNTLNEFLYLYMKTNILDLISGASGGAQQHINKQMVENYNILIPPEDIIEKFNKKVLSNFILIKELSKENIYLKSQRDQLLFRLI